MSINYIDRSQRVNRCTKPPYSRSDDETLRLPRVTPGIPRRTQETTSLSFSSGRTDSDEAESVLTYKAPTDRSADGPP